MDWDLAIKRNSKALKGIIAVLFALLGLDGTEAASRIPRSLHSAVLGVLRPAESAVRRLIVIAARNVVVKLAPSRPMPEDASALPKEVAAGQASPAFQLFDPRKRFKFARGPRRKSPGSCRASISWEMIQRWPPSGQSPSLWLSPRRRPMGWPVPRASTAGSRPSSSPLRTFPARPGASSACRKGGRPRLSTSELTPLRPGRPPGYRRKPIHEVDEILADCDFLAWEAMKPDTS